MSSNPGAAGRSSGAPIAVFAPGALTNVGEHLRAPIGPIHFAGTETAIKARITT